MTPSSALPKFKKPPISEVVVGVQFSSPVIAMVHFGLFFERIRDRFPNTSTQPPLPPMFENFGVSPWPPNFAVPMPLFLGSGGAPVMNMTIPRVWFRSADGCSLVQLQSDRFLYNWSCGNLTDRAIYPHFGAIYSEFDAILNELMVFCSEEQLGALNVTQCELTYVNPLPTKETGVPVSAPHEIFKEWNSDRGPEWMEPLEDLSFMARYRFLDHAGSPFGRLSVNLASGLAAPDFSQTFNLELTARGMPKGPERGGYAEFFAYAHEAIVKCFAAMTTPKMHDLWERIQ